ELPIRTIFESPTVNALAARLDEGSALRQPLAVMPRPARLPLSFAQQRLWFLHRLEGSSSTYNLPYAVRLNGSLDLPALHVAIAYVLKRHQSLRTRFKEGPLGPEQELVELDPTASLVNLHEVADADLDAELRAAAGYKFDLAQEIPVRVDLFRTSDT